MPSFRDGEFSIFSDENIHLLSLLLLLLLLVDFVEVDDNGEVEEGTAVVEGAVFGFEMVVVAVAIVVVVVVEAGAVFVNDVSESLLFESFEPGFVDETGAGGGMSCFDCELVVLLTVVLLLLLLLIEVCLIFEF
jgi:hypothetical protein